MDDSVLEPLEEPSMIYAAPQQQSPRGHQDVAISESSIDLESVEDPLVKQQEE